MSRKPHCIVCESKPATKPIGAPLFCSLRCGFASGVQNHGGFVWCATCQNWFNGSDDPLHDKHEEATPCPTPS